MKTLEWHVGSSSCSVTEHVHKLTVRSSVSFSSETKTSPSSSPRSRPKTQLNNNNNNNNNNNQLFIVIDTSYSMASSLSNAAEAVRLILDGAYNAFDDISLVCFNDKVQTHSLSSYQDLSRAKDFVSSKCVPGGGTSFVVVMDELTENVKRTPNIFKTDIVFLTDGKDGCGKKQRDTSLKNLMTQLSSRQDSRIHSIGFTRYHDAALLTELTNSGLSEGSFQYVTEKSELENAAESIMELLKDSAIGNAIASLSFNTNYSNVEDYVRIEKSHFDESSQHVVARMEMNRIQEDQDGNEINSESNVVHKGNIFLPIDTNQEGKESLLSLTLEIMLPDHMCDTLNDHEELTDSGRIKRVFKLTPKLKESSGNFQDVVEFIEARIRALTRNVVDITENENDTTKFNSRLDVIKNEAERLNEIVTQHMSNVMKLPRMKRKEFFEVAQSTKDMMHAFYQILASARSRNLQNHQLASLNNMAYQRISKKGLSTKLAKRIEKNVDWYQDNSKAIEREVEKMNFEQLKKDYQNLLDETREENVGTCILTCNNWIDALEDQDCLGIALDVSRSEAAVMDPSKLKIRSIHNTIISAGSFSDALRFTLPKSPQAAGDYNINAQGEILVGQAREPVTGVFPLYICEPHWKVARRHMKPLLAWMTTLEELGYSAIQLQTVPFSVLAKSVETMNQSSRNRIQFDWIRKTCEKIFEECKNMQTPTQSQYIKDINLEEEIETNNEYKALPKECPILRSENIPMSTLVKYLFENYVSEPGLRTANIIIGNQAFLAQILCCVTSGVLSISDIDRNYLDKFFLCVVEEEIRRCLPIEFRQMTSQEADQLAVKLLYPGDVNQLNKSLGETQNEFSRELSQLRNDHEQGKIEISTPEEIMMKGLISGEKQIEKSQKSIDNLNMNDDNHNHNDDDDKESENGDKIQQIFNSLRKKSQEIRLRDKLDVNDRIWDNASMQKIWHIIEKVTIPVMHMKAWFLAQIGDGKDSKELINEMKDSLTIKTLGFSDPLCFLAIVFQNILQSKNSKRIQAIVGQEYHNFLASDSPNSICNQYLVSRIERYVQNEHIRCLQSELNALQASKGSELGRLFATSESMLHAAGLIYGIKYGDPILFHSLIQSLQKCEVRHAYQKIEILIYGHFRGVKLFYDENLDGVEMGHNRFWDPSKKNSFRIWKNNQTQLSRGETEKLFPKWVSTIPLWEAEFGVEENEGN
eukprot:gb/GECH01009205.1/.p1 GENE.gb/GECH01009205.1/~~gb/GECH01009205.1/.p1  ORF type:complete len:1208 (+),score=323.18 gb/GECH01009205.1/:1-3624(+)